MLKKRKIILLDIDGVLAPFGRIDDSKIISLSGWQNIAIENENVNLIKYITSNKIEIIWISTWEDISNCINKSIGIDDFKYLTFNDNYNDEWLKHNSILQYVKTFKRVDFLLIDDEIPNSSSLFKEKNLKIIKPNEIFGINNTIRNEIISWIKLS